MAPSLLEKLTTERESDKFMLKLVESKVQAHSTTPTTAGDVTFYSDETTRIFDRIRAVSIKIALAPPTDSSLEEAEVTAIFNTMSKIKLELERIKLSHAASATTSTSSTSSGSTVSTSVVKLPTIKLPTFNGNVNDWISYRDMFVSTVHNNSTLSDVQKLTYLQSSLNGSAAKLIQSIAITDANFQIAWDILKNRYENKRELYFSIMKKLINYPNVLNDNSNGLRTLIDLTNECTRALNSISVVDKWDAILVFVLTQKLDPASRQFWELTLKGTDIPTSAALLEFVKQRARSLAACESTIPKQQPKPANYGDQKRQQVFHADHQRKEQKFQPCKLCEGNHMHFRCPVLLALGVPERQQLIKEQRLCFNCLRDGHSLSTCKSERSCFNCKKRHHTVLHSNKENSASNSTSAGVKNFHVKNQNYKSNQTLLATAVVRVQVNSGEFMPVKAMLDGGSTTSFISESCASRLGLHRKWTNAVATGFGSTTVGRAKGVVELMFKPRFDPNVKNIFTTDAYIMTKLTGKLPVMACDTKSWTHLNNLQLADPEFSVPNDIDLLLGADVFYDLILGDKKTGPTGSALTPEESLCEEILVKTHTRDSTGRYIVHIPFKIPQVQLGSSREMARRRFLQLEKRLEAKPNIQKLYQDFMNKYEELGHMEHIKSWASNPRRNFLPHQFVLKDTQKLEKFCVVFDGSAKTSSGVSFNETQLVGQQLQDPLMTILMRFRQHPIGFTADIAKMFRQIRVVPVHQELQCVLWRNDPSKPIKEYKLSTVTYGTASGPFLATRVLKQMALDEEARLPLASAVTKMDFYVDDLISGAETEELAYQTIQQLREITDSAGQCLRKFASNSQFALKNVPLDLKETTELLSMDDGDEVVKTLGIHWNTVTDSFMFKVKPHPSSKKLTKRNVLSEISMIFDPMGWLAPSIICNKILMQDIWKEKIGWDDLPSQPILDRWIKFKESLFFFEQIKIPRCFAPKSSSTLELHGFSDASEKAYAAVVYIRALSSAGQINVSIITSKTKAAPVQTVSIPRLELCAAELLAELMDAVQTALQLKFVDIRAWTDSTIVLAWINASPSRWKKFVANRVTKIQEVLSPAQWNHVSGVENPADCASRGISPEELLHHKLWWTGPRWLHDIEPHPAPSPVLAVDDELLKSSMEEKTLLVAATTVEWEFLHQFSSLLKLKCVTAYIRRFINNIQQRILQNKSLDHQTKFLTGPLLVSELNSALIVWIKKAQNMVFETEIQRCKDGLPISNTSKILSLSPFIDQENILRVGGRLRHAKIHNDLKHPILLPRHNRLTEILKV